MNRNENDILKVIFIRMAENEDTLPDGFHAEMMERIRQENMWIQKRNERLQALFPFAISLFIGGLAVAFFACMGISLPEITFPTISIPAPYLLTGILVLLLLVTDIFVRQAYYKKHPF
jgi:hypothetical protein